MSNLRFTKVYVIDPVNTKFITDTGKKPTDLTLGQVGIFKIDQQGVTLGGTGATPAPATVRRVKFAQNVGDSDYGTVKSQIIDVESVVNYFGKLSRAATTQITYIGYDEADEDKDISVNCGKEVIIPIMIWEKKLARWYAPTGFIKRLVIDTECCPDCGSPCTAADKTAFATAIAAAINTGLQRDGDFEAGNELSQYLTATVVDNGEVDDAKRVGVKIETKAIDNDAQSALDSCDPNKWFEFQTYYFTVGSAFDGICDGTVLPVTTTQKADPGTGWPAALAALEAESQGYDRVRDPVTNYPFNAKNNYKIFAVAGKKYDYYHVNFNFTHNAGGASTGTFIKEPYEILIAVPTGTGGDVEACLNAWLVNRFPAVTL